MNKRIFVAIDISEEARAKIVAIVHDLKADFPHVRAGWEKPEKIHLTLKFLGNIDDGKLEKLREAVRKTAKSFAPLLLRVEKTGCFPSLKKARTLWIGLSDERGSLRDLREKLEEEAAARGFEKENRGFKPHLTIVRLREPGKSGELTTEFLQKHFEPVSFEVSEIVIYESELRPTGSVYSVIEKQKLGVAAS